MILLGFIISLLVPIADHALYLSVLEMNINDRRYEIIIKVFDDDLSDALRNFIQNPNPTDEALSDYFGQNLILKTNDVRLEYKFVKSTISGDSRIITFEAYSAQLPNEIVVSAPYFMELFPMQKNICKIKMGEKKRYHIFQLGAEKYSFNFSD